MNRPSPRYFRRLAEKAPQGQFWLFFAASLFFSFGFSIFFFLFNLYLLGFGFNERTLGLIGSFSAVGSILGTIPAGICAERFGIRRTLVGGLLCTVVFSVLRICFLSQPAQFGLATLTGMTLCFWAVCLSPAVASLTREPERPFAFSLMFSSALVLPPSARWLPGSCQAGSATFRRDSPPGIHRGRGHRLTLEFACGAAAVSILPLLALSLPGAAPRVRLPRLSNPFLRRFLPAMAVWSLVTGSFPPFANVYFAHHLGLSLKKMGFVFSLSQLVQFLAVLSAPLLLQAHGAGQRSDSDPIGNSCGLGLAGVDPPRGVGGMGVPDLHGGSVHE